MAAAGPGAGAGANNPEFKCLAQYAIYEYNHQHNGQLQLEEVVSGRVENGEGRSYTIALKAGGIVYTATVVVKTCNLTPAG